MAKPPDPQIFSPAAGNCHSPPLWHKMIFCKYANFGTLYKHSTNTASENFGKIEASRIDLSNITDHASDQKVRNFEFTVGYALGAYVAEPQKTLGK